MYPPGSYTALSSWLFTALTSAPTGLAGIGIISDTWLVCWLSRLLGGKLAAPCPFSRILFAQLDLLDVEDNVSMGAGANLLGCVSEGSNMRIDRVSLSKGAFTGPMSVVMPGASVGRNTIIGTLTLATGTYDQNSVYVGSPAICIRKGEEPVANPSPNASQTVSTISDQLFMLLLKIVIPNSLIAGTVFFYMGGHD
jgi:hypothetical protein